MYPSKVPQRRWFEHYTTLFDTVELNNTFYRLPPPATVDAWAAQAPPGFTYAVKVGAFGSHRMKLRDAASWLPNHLDRVERLGPALGPNLVQLPPRWRRDTGRLDEMLAVAPKHLRWAVEVREPSWVHEEVLEVLRRHGAALCIHDLLADHPWELTTDWTYLRFHGPDALRAAYSGSYTGRRLWRVAERLDAWLDQGIDVYAYFNNDIGAAAVADARWLRDRLAAGAHGRGRWGRGEGGDGAVMTDAVTGDAVSKEPDVVPDDPATHPEAESGSEVQASSQDAGATMGVDQPDGEPEG